MKKFVIKVALFFLALLIFAFAVEPFITKNLKKSTWKAEGEYNVWNDIYNGKASSEVIILGSSRAFIQLDPAAIENTFKKSCYNIGVDGQRMIIQNFRFNEYLKHNQKPSFLLFSLDPVTLTHRETLFNYQQFFPYMLYNKELYEVTKNYDGLKWEDFFLPAIRYFGHKDYMYSAIRIYRNPNADYPVGRVRGFARTDKSWSKQNDQFLQSSEITEVGLDPEYVKTFEALIQKCREKNITIAFIYTPQLREVEPHMPNLKTVMNYYAETARKNSILFLDYSKDSISLNREYFYDPIHLNLNGVKVFNQKLVGDLRANNFFNQN